MIAAKDLTGLILAGGKGTRMGGIDKGLQPFRGYPFVMHVLLRLAPQVGRILISANRNLDAYQELGHTVITDTIADIGPLGGIHTGLIHCQTDYLLTAPCDTPFLPRDLAARLARALIERPADIAVARTGGQPQPLFCLVRRSVLNKLATYIRSGGRKADGWYGSQGAVEVEFDDRAECFLNINTLPDLAALRDSIQVDNR